MKQTMIGLVGMWIAAGAFAQPAEGPPSVSPLERQMQARRLAESGDYARALHELLVCFDEGVKQDPSYASVRNSFLIREIAELGRKYTPALEALRERRDAAETNLRQGTGTADDVTTFCSINRQLNMNDSTLAVYDQLLLSSKDTELIHLMARLSFEPLLAARRYRDIELGQPDLLAAAMRQFDVHEEAAPSGVTLSPEAAAALSNVRLQTLRDTVGKYYEVLEAVGRHDDAKQLADRLLHADASAETYLALARHALRSKNPSTYDVSLAQTADTKSGGRDATALAVYAELMAMTGRVDPAVTMLQQRIPAFTTSSDKAYLDMTLHGLAKYAKPSEADFPADRKATPPPSK